MAYYSSSVEVAVYFLPRCLVYISYAASGLLFHTATHRPLDNNFLDTTVGLLVRWSIQRINYSV